MTDSDFDKLVKKAVRELPDFFKGKMENVVVLVADKPTPAQERRFGKTLLGLYEGIPLLGRGAYYSGAMPDKITVFKKNLEAYCLNGRDLKKEVKHVIMHEIAHHFGIDDDRLMKEGLY